MVDIVISTIDDPGICTGRRDLELVLSNPSFGVLQADRATGEIDDNDYPDVTLAAVAATAEGTNIVATVSLSAACATTDITFLANTVSGTAVSPADFAALTDQLGTITAGNTSTTITITTIDDALYEFTEEFDLVLSSLSHGSFAVNQRTYQITSDDPMPTLNVASAVRVLEGETASIRLELDAVSGVDVTFDYQTSDLTATGGADYTAIALTSGTLAAGGTSLVIPVTTLADSTICEGDETLTLTVSNVANAFTSNLISTITIEDDDLPIIALADASGTEGATLTFNVDLSFACPSNDMSFNYRTIENTALAGRSYIETSGTLTITAGITTGSFDVLTIDNATRERDKVQFFVGVTEVNYTKRGTESLANGFITDNETAIETIHALTTGYNTACALSSAGDLGCWGHLSYQAYEPYLPGQSATQMGDNLLPVDLGTHDKLGITPHTALQVTTAGPRNVILLDTGQVKIFGGTWQTNHLKGDLVNYYPLGTLDGLGLTPHTAKQVARHEPQNTITVCAVLNDNRLKCAGSNGTGQAGAESSSGYITEGDPAGYVDLGTHDGLGVTPHTAKSVVIWDQRTCALLDDNRVKCWGSGSGGKLGTGNTLNVGQVPGSMGDNLPYLDLGTGRTVKLLRNKCAILDNDRLKCWGLNQNGQLGLGDTNHRGDEPNEMGDNLPYVDLGTHNGLGVTPHTVKDVVSAEFHTCAILDDNRLKCWGASLDFRLGLSGGYRGGQPGDMGDNLPYVDLGAGRTAKKLSAATPATFVLRDDDSLVGFGRNRNAELGRGDLVANAIGNDLVPVSLGTGLYATDLPEGPTYEPPFVLLNNGQVKSWRGRDYWNSTGNARFQLARGHQPGEMGTNIYKVPLPTSKKMLHFESSAYWLATQNICGIFDDGSLGCWGQWRVTDVAGSQVEQGLAKDSLGDNLATYTFASPIVKVEILGSTDDPAGCALSQAGKVYCFGFNSLHLLNGTFSRNSSNLSLVPEALIGTNLRAIDIVAGNSHFCILTHHFKVKCWGNGNLLGYGDTLSRGNTAETSGDNLPFVDLGTVSHPVDLAAGDSATCARFANGKVKCWGGNGDGELGLGDTLARGVSAGQMGDNLPFIDLGAFTAKKIWGSKGIWGREFCALRSDDNTVCWGRTAEVMGTSTSQIGRSPAQMGDSMETLQLNGDVVEHLSAQSYFACAFTRVGTVKCWGNNTWGGNGQGDLTQRWRAQMGASLPPIDIQW